MRASLRNAKYWGADTVLLVPRWSIRDQLRAGLGRSQREIRKLIPLAAEAKVIIGIEGSGTVPPQPARVCGTWTISIAVDSRVFRRGQRGDHRIPAGLDSHPGQADREAVLRTSRSRSGSLSSLRCWKAEIDFKAVHAALAEIGYQGTATVELNGGDGPYLKSQCPV